MGSKVNHNFLQNMSPEAAWLVGLISADGYILKNRHAVSFHMADDHLLKQVKDISDFEGNIHKTKENTCRMDIFSEQWVRNLRFLGIRNKKSLTLELPHIDPHVFPDFVRGYFDGDGSFWNQKNPLRTNKTLRSQIIGSVPFVTQLSRELEQWGFPKRTVHPAGNAGKIQYAHYDSVKLGELMYYQNQGPRHERKCKLWSNARRKGK